MNGGSRWLFFLVLVVGIWWLLPSKSSPVGTQLPPLVVRYLPGAEPYAPGRPAVIEFWATWCPPCRKSITHLNELKQKGADLGLQVIGITDEDEATVTEFRRGVPMDYTVAVDINKGMARHFKVNAIPYAVLADRTGKIRWVGHPAELSEFTLREALR